MAQGKKSKPTPMIIPTPNGPYYYFTDMKPKVIDGLTNSKGEQFSNLQGAALCRCGASDNKPFCVGKHSLIGFSERKETNDDGDQKRQVPAFRTRHLIGVQEL